MVESNWLLPENLLFSIPKFNLNSFGENEEILVLQILINKSLNEDKNLSDSFNLDKYDVNLGIFFNTWRTEFI